MCRLVCAFVVYKQQSQGVSHRGPCDAEANASWPPPCYAPDKRIYMVDGIHFSSPHYQFVHPREEEEGDNSSETVDSLVLLSNNYIGKTCIHKA